MVILLTLSLPVPPSVPTCQIQGSLDVGSDVMLFCSSEEGIPTPSYSWEKLDALPRLPHNAMQGITNKLAIGVPFCPNFAGKCHTQGWAQAQHLFHHLCHLSCTRPTLSSPNLTDPGGGENGWMVVSHHVDCEWLCQPDDNYCSFSGFISFMLNTRFYCKIRL